MLWVQTGLNLLWMWHSSKNEEKPPNDRLLKIQPLIDMWISKFQGMLSPEKLLYWWNNFVLWAVTDKTLHLKAHKYGIKVFTLYTDMDYTWNLSICWQEGRFATCAPTNVVLKISDSLLAYRRTVVTDNYYTSVELVNNLHDFDTNHLGTMHTKSTG
jgi:hypothetical protein